MSNWYYYDKNGNKVGPITSTAIKALAQQGLITPDTALENEQGQSAKAGTVKGLEFKPITVSSVSVPVPPLVSSPTPTLSPSVSSRNIMESKSPSGRLVVRSEPIVYIPKGANSAFHPSFFDVTLDGKAPEETNASFRNLFHVNGVPVSLRFQISDKKIVDYGVFSSPHGDNRYVFTFNRPGTVSITFSAGNEVATRTITVVEVPIEITPMHIASTALTQNAYHEHVVQNLGIPDEEYSFDVSHPNNCWMDRICYKPSPTDGTIRAKHLRYNKYPGLVVSIVKGQVHAISSCKLRIKNPADVLASGVFGPFMGHGIRSLGCAIMLAMLAGLLSSGIVCCSLILSMLF